MGEYAFLAVYRQSYGMSLSNLRDAGNGMTEVWVILAVEWVVFMMVAWYLEQVRQHNRRGRGGVRVMCTIGAWCCGAINVVATDGTC